MCLPGALSYIPFNLICGMATFQNIFDILTQPQGPRVRVRRVYVLAWCSIPFNLICNMINFRNKSFCLTAVAEVCVRTKYVLACCPKFHSL